MIKLRIRQQLITQTSILQYATLLEVENMLKSGAVSIEILLGEGNKIVLYPKGTFKLVI